MSSLPELPEAGPREPAEPAPARVRIGWALGGAVAALAALVLLSYGWVAIYSHLIHPGQERAFYEAYALVASPWVAALGGFPVYFALGRLLRARTGSSARRTALGAWAVHAVLSVGITAAAGALGSMLAMELLSRATSLAGAVWGTRG